MRKCLLLAQLLHLFLLSWTAVDATCTDAAESGNCNSADFHYHPEEEEDSDDTTLLAMPQRPKRRAAVPRRTGESAVRSYDATSLFQVEEFVSGPDVGLVKPEGRAHEQALSEPRPLQMPSAPSGLAAIRVDMGEERTRPETWFLVATVALVLVTLSAWGCLFQNGKEASQGLAPNPELRKQVMKLPLRSAEEILQKLAPAAPAGVESNQWNSGVLVRLEGRVVAKNAQIMATPFSDRQCVMYSASASHKRQDGVHQPPLAYHAACSDFALELEHPEGTAPMQITVHGHDVLLFEMSKGRFSRESPFSEVPEAWRGFALAHLIHGADASCNAMSCVDLGTKGALEFCESALLDGSRVTCVGEVVRDRNGSLSLCPWRPPVVGLDSPQQTRSRVDTLRAALFGKLSTTSWETPGKGNSALAGQVLISDCSDFIDNSSPFWRRLMRGPGWQSTSLLVS